MPTRSVLRYPILIFGVTSCAPAAEREEKRDADELAAATASVSSDSATCFVSGRSVLARLRSMAGAAGRLHAHSDAALERDSSGKLREFRRDSRILFSRASCDSMPPPAGGAAIDGVALGTPRPGIRFDPSTLRRQARIGTLIVDSIHTRRAMDSTWIGTVRFRGDIELSGWTLRNPDPDLYRVLTCFEAIP